MAFVGGEGAEERGRGIETGRGGWGLGSQRASPKATFEQSLDTVRHDCRKE